MNIEYLRLAQLRDLICEVVPQKAIRQCRTDCWLVSTSKKKVEELKRHLKDQTFKSIQRRTPFTPIPPPAPHGGEPVPHSRSGHPREAREARPEA